MGSYVDNRNNDRYRDQYYYNNNIGNMPGCYGTSTGEMITNAVTNTIFGALTMWANVSESKSSAPEKEVDASQIEKEITNILNKYDMNADGSYDTAHSDDYTANISDLQTQIESKKLELQKMGEDYKAQTTELNTKVKEREDAQKKLEPINKKLEAKRTRLNTVNNEITLKTEKAGQLEQKIANLQNSENVNEPTVQNAIKKAQEDLRKLNEEIRKLTEEQEKLSKTEIPALENEAKPYEEKISALEPRIAELNEQIKPLTELKSDIKEMEEDLAKLKDLQKQLKKANGSDAIEGLQNKGTEDITKYVKKLREAESGDDDSKKAKALTDLKNAMTLYYAEPDNIEADGSAKNKTIEMLARKIGFKK